MTPDLRPRRGRPAGAAGARRALPADFPDRRGDFAFALRSVSGTPVGGEEACGSGQVEVEREYRIFQPDEFTRATSESLSRDGHK